MKDEKEKFLAEGSPDRDLEASDVEVWGLCYTGIFLLSLFILLPLAILLFVW